MTVEAKRSRFRSVVALAAAGTVVLGACRSEPGPQRVALDLVDSIQEANGQEITDEQRECMVDVLENKYTNDQLKKIGEEAEAGDTVRLTGLQADIEACLD